MTGIELRQKRRKMQRTRQLFSLTPDEMNILLTIRDYGFLDSKDLFDIVQHRGFTGTIIWMRKLTRGLSEKACISIKPRSVGAKRDVYSLAVAGHRFLTTNSLDLPCGEDARNDAATSQHFMTMASISSRFMEQIPTSYWMTDLQVRSENFVGKERAFAKDYDGVFQGYIGDDSVTVGVEYERVRKSKQKYWEISKCYAHDKHIQMVLIVVPSETWNKPIAEAFDSSSRGAEVVYFLSIDELMARPLKMCTVAHLSPGRLDYDSLLKCMRVSSSRKRIDYDPKFAWRPRE